MRKEQDVLMRGARPDGQANTEQAAVTPGARRRTARLYEQAGRGGAGRLVERWGLLWRWETWASDVPLSRRPRGGWTLTYAAAVATSSRVLQGYSLGLGEHEQEMARRFERGAQASGLLNADVRASRARGIG
jgi:hypothetical protein